MAGRPPTQESLLVVSETVGEMQPADFDASLGVNSRIEQKLYLINALADLSGAKMREGFEVIGGTAEVRERYGDHTSRVVEGARRARAELLISAEDNFKKGEKYEDMEALRKTGAWVVNGAHKHPYSIHRQMYSDFLKAFYLAGDWLKRAEYRKQLMADIAKIREWPEIEQEVTRFNREQQLRPHQSPEDGAPADVTTEERRTLDKLDTRNRLLAILYDPRAGFIPATHREKNQVITFLDYLDNPQYPFGSIDQLAEVYAHVKWRQTPAEEDARTYMPKDHEARRAIESRIWEMGDYLADAAKAHRVLSELKTSTADISPRVTLAEELGVGQEALPYLVRYFDLAGLVETGTVPRLKRDPLRTAEDRWVPDKHALEPGKHKTVHGQYTRPDMTRDFQQHIERRATTLTFADLRSEIDNAIDNELQRAYFHWQRLYDVQRFTNYKITRGYIEALTASLADVKGEPVLQLLINGRLK